MKVSIGTTPPTEVESASRYDELVETALENRGQWVSAALGDDEKINTNHYSLVYRKIAKKLGVIVKTSGSSIYIRIPEK